MTMALWAPCAVGRGSGRPASSATAGRQGTSAGMAPKQLAYPVARAWAMARAKSSETSYCAISSSSSGIGPNSSASACWAGGGMLLTPMLATRSTVNAPSRCRASGTSPIVNLVPAHRLRSVERPRHRA